MDFSKRDISDIFDLSIGIDPGSYSFKASYSDGKNSTLIAEIVNKDFNILREECEISLDNFICSCVIAVPKEYSQTQKEELAKKVKLSGFDEVKFISSVEAASFGINHNGKVLLSDFGKTRTEIIILNHGIVFENIIFNDFNGDFFDKIFSEWLSERLMRKININDAEKIKIFLSDNAICEISEGDLFKRNKKIFREDFERLIRFSIRRVMRTLRRLESEYNPDRIIFTGGLIKIPLLKKISMNILRTSPEFIDNLISEGASVCAFKSGIHKKEKIDFSAKLKDLKNDLFNIEGFLTRNQKDKIWYILNRAESTPEIVPLIENLTSEIEKVL